MRNGLLFGILLLGFASLTSAAYEWYWIGCNEAFNMGSSGGMDLIPCAISQSTGGGGSKIITHNNYYCLYFTEWRTAGNFRLHAVLYKGVNCENWSPGDYCYDKMDVGEACNKYVDWGTHADLGGGPYGYTTLSYTTTYWGPVAFSHGGSPLINKMGFKIRVAATGGRRSGNGIIKQTDQLPSSFIPAVKRLRR